VSLRTIYVLLFLGEVLSRYQLFLWIDGADEFNYTLTAIAPAGSVPLC
jgi:hypothetical protein